MYTKVRLNVLHNTVHRKKRVTAKFSSVHTLLYSTIGMKVGRNKEKKYAAVIMIITAEASDLSRAEALLSRVYTPS